MTVELTRNVTGIHTVNFYDDVEKKTYLVKAAREIWDALINDDWNVYSDSQKKAKLLRNQKNGCVEKKQRVKSSMTGFDKLKKNSNYALEA